MAYLSYWVLRVLFTARHTPDPIYPTYRIFPHILPCVSFPSFDLVHISLSLSLSLSLSRTLMSNLPMRCKHRQTHPNMYAHSLTHIHNYLGCLVLFNTRDKQHRCVSWKDGHKLENAILKKKQKGKTIEHVKPHTRGLTNTTAKSSRPG